MAADELRLQRSTEQDASLAWSWRNAESTRRFSTDSAPVPYERHIQWWGRALADERRDLLLAAIGSTPVGVVRLDHSGTEAVVSIYLDPALTGLGLGPRTLIEMQKWSLSHRPDTLTLVADVLPDNKASIAAFTAAGFRPEGAHFVWRAAA